VKCGPAEKKIDVFEIEPAKKVESA